MKKWVSKVITKFAEVGFSTGKIRITYDPRMVSNNIKKHCLKNLEDEK